MSMKVGIHATTIICLPMGLPDWVQRFTWKKSKGPSDACYGSHTNDDEDDEDGDGKMVPPHEYIARRLARTHITPSSMCEGVGRTLKGRDLPQTQKCLYRPKLVS
ncbi:senescence regulator S40 [Tanacetum coccineum]